MGDWVDVDPFIDDQVRRVDTWQGIWHNLDSLHNRNYAEYQNEGTSVWQFTTTGTWLEIDGGYYQKDFESFGNDVLVTAFVHTTHLTTSGITSWRFSMDGTAVGNTDGLMRTMITTTDAARETYCLSYLWTNFNAGDHTVMVEVRNDTSGTVEVFREAGLKMTVVEF